MHKKIDIFGKRKDNGHWDYICTTQQSRTCKDAVLYFVCCGIAKPNVKLVGKDLTYGQCDAIYADYKARFAK